MLSIKFIKLLCFLLWDIGKAASEYAISSSFKRNYLYYESTIKERIFVDYAKLTKLQKQITAS